MASFFKQVPISQMILCQVLDNPSVEYNFEHF